MTIAKDNPQATLEISIDVGFAIEEVEVFRASRKHPDALFGPLPGMQSGQVVAYEFGLPERFEQWAGRGHLERTFVLLDVGVSFSNPLWVRAVEADGLVIDQSREGEDCWYVDLVTVEAQLSSYTFTDLYVDVMVPTNERHYRMLDLDEFADALDAGQMTQAEAADGLRRWQRFLDTHLHSESWPISTWSDFPPASIAELAALPSPIGTPVFWED